MIVPEEFPLASNFLFRSGNRCWELGLESQGTYAVYAQYLHKGIHVYIRTRIDICVHKERTGEEKGKE